MKEGTMLRPLIAAAAIAAVAAHASDARACGCFAQPSAATPVVQAGERILFAHEGDQVIAYIQIKYQGAADQFGWLVPLPSIPTLEVGTDELFSTLDSTTLPQYQLNRTFQYCGGGSSTSSSTNGSGGCGADDFTGTGASDMGASFAGRDMASRSGDMGSDIVAAQASIGPYEYAVLKADDESAMLQWLSDNGYFVPTGTMDAVKPYINPGAYFLALKLRGGQSTGDIAPIVLRYTSQLPMIPITLTSVGAVPNMGILVWVLGEARAIPRNYYSVVLDDLPVWFDNFASYNQQLIAAVKEAPGKHGFITQYAGPRKVVGGRLDYYGRFGDLAELRAITTASQYLSYLRTHGYTFDGTLLAILSRYIPEPQVLVDRGVSLAQFYANYDGYSQYVPGTDPDGGVIAPLDAGALTDELDTRIVTPTKNAAALLSRHSYLTRMYTAMSPADMTVDPVFSSNQDLPDVPLLHQATITTPCSGQPWLRTDGGFETQYVSGFPPNVALPASLRVDKLLDAGQPEPVQDNTATIKTALGTVDYGSMNSPGATTYNPDANDHGSGCGCTVGGVRVRPDAAVLLALCAGTIAVRSLRRRRR
jgi:uncharacterized protein DUF2330